MVAIASTRITPAAQVTAGLYSPKTSVAAGAGRATCSLMASQLCAHSPAGNASFRVLNAAADAEHEDQHRERDQPPGEIREAVDAADDAVERGREIAVQGAAILGYARTGVAGRALAMPRRAAAVPALRRRAWSARRACIRRPG